MLVSYSPFPCFRCDATVATFWETVWAVLGATADMGRLHHFVQDDEAAFYPVGSQYLRCIEAMRQNFSKIAYGPWMQRTLAQRYDMPSQLVPFFLDKATYRPRRGIARRKDLVVFFARPDMPRRCYELGLAAVAMLRTDCEVVFFGSRQLPESALPAHCRNVGVLSPTDLARLYSEATVGLALSTTNPSLVPYEMMACGLPVVGLDVAGNDRHYGAPDCCRLCPPDAAVIAAAVTGLLDDPQACAALGENGRRLAAGMADVEATAQCFLEALGLAGPA